LLGGELPFDIVDAQGITDELNDPAFRPSGDDLIRLQPQLSLLIGLEDLIHQGDHLHRELLLAEVVPTLHNEPRKLPRLQVSEDRLLSHPPLLLLSHLLDQEVVHRLELYHLEVVFFLVPFLFFVPF